jgi:hypothetical protein
MLALQLEDELKRTAGKKSIIIQVGPLRKRRRMQLEDDGNSAEEQEDEGEEEYGGKVRIVLSKCSSKRMTCFTAKSRRYGTAYIE